MRASASLAVLFVTACAVAPQDPATVPQISRGLSVIMALSGDDARRQEAGQPPALYVALAQPAVSNAPQIFKTHAELIDYFDALPNSVRREGVWVKRMARHLWNAEDDKRLGELTRLASAGKVLLYACEPKESKGKTGLAAWLVEWHCTTATPAAAFPKVICQAQPEKDKASGPEAWRCSESNT